jgi:putative ABC transport system permease protein
LPTDTQLLRLEIIEGRNLAPEDADAIVVNNALASMGVMRALGATPRIVWLMIVAEGIVIGLLSWTIAALLAWPVSKVAGNFIVKVMFRSGLDFTFEPLGLLIWIVVSISLSAAASFLPAWKASRVTVREALAYE